MCQARWTAALLGVTLLGLGVSTAWADELTPVVVASIHDEPLDGYGDYFNDPPFEGLLRQLSYREDRAIQEYDVSPYAGMTVTSATISGTIYVNNGAGSWPRVFDFILYHGNGQADVSDFEQAEGLIKSAVETYGKLDILVNNAGLTRDQVIMRMPEEDWDLVIRVNLKSAYN